MLARAPTARARRSRVVATYVIVAVIGLQAIAGFRLLCPPKSVPALAFLRVCCPPMLWPFTDYPMYSQAYQPGRWDFEYRVHGITRDGLRWPFDQEGLGVNFRSYRTEFVAGLLKGDFALSQPILSGWLMKRPEIVELVVIAEPIEQRPSGEIARLPTHPVRRYFVTPRGTLAPAELRAGGDR